MFYCRGAIFPRYERLVFERNWDTASVEQGKTKLWYQGIKQVVKDQISTQLQHDLTSTRRPTDIHIQMQVKLDK